MGGRGDRRQAAVNPSLIGMASPHTQPFAQERTTMSRCRACAFGKWA